MSKKKNTSVTHTLAYDLLTIGMIRGNGLGKNGEDRF